MFELENITSDDPRSADILVGYLAQYDDPGVRMRPRDAVDRAIASGLALVIKRDGVVCGCSLVYQFNDDDDERAFSEIGTMRITANGFDLQSFLARFHLLQMSLEEHFAEAHTIFAVVSPNTASEHNLANKVGMKQWDPPAVLQVMRSASGVAFSNKKYCLVAETNTIDNAVNQLCYAHIEDNLFATPKGSEKVRVKVKWFTSDLLNGFMKQR